MIRMSTGHMEGNLQLVYVLLTDCYVYLIRKGISTAPAHLGCYNSQFSKDSPLEVWELGEAMLDSWLA